MTANARRDTEPASCAPMPAVDAEVMRNHADDAARLLKAISNSSRLMVLCSLAKGEQTVGQLNDRVPLSQSALSQHLAVLRRDGIVQTRRSAQTIYYSLAAGPATRIIETLYEIFCGADTR